MADQKISQLTTISSLSPSDALPIVDETGTPTTKKLLISQLDARYSPIQTWKVACSDADDNTKAQAKYVLAGGDGDNITVQGAIADLISAAGGKLKISGGHIYYDGDEVQVFPQQIPIWLEGEGSRATTFVQSSTTQNGIHIGNRAAGSSADFATNFRMTGFDVSMPSSGTVKAGVLIDGLGGNSLIEDVQTNNGYNGFILKDLDRAVIRNISANNPISDGILCQAGLENTWGNVYMQMINATTINNNTSGLRFMAAPEQSSPNRFDRVVIESGLLYCNVGLTGTIGIKFDVGLQSGTITGMLSENNIKHFVFNDEFDITFIGCSGIKNDGVSSDMFYMDSFGYLTSLSNKAQQVTNVFNGVSGSPRVTLLGLHKNNGNVTNIFAGSFGGKFGTDTLFAGDAVLASGINGQRYGYVFAQNISGVEVIQPQSDTTTAIIVKDTNGNAVFTFDTTNRRVVLASHSLGTITSGAIENDGTHIYFSSGSTRYQLDRQTISAALSTLTDATITTPSDKQFLSYDNASSKWKNRAMTSSDITTALGYTPTNPSGATTQYVRGDGSLSTFNTDVRSNRLDQMTAPSASVSMNSQKITSLLDPTSAQDAATKNYVDALAQGLSVKPSAIVATTTTLPTYTYLSGVITMTSTGVIAIDGRNLALGDIILIKNETSTNAPYNGLYTVTTAGAVGVALVLTRHVNMDTTGEFQGSFVFVESGTVNASAGFVCTNSSAVTVGTTNVAFAQFSGAGEITNGNGLSKSANTLSIDTTVTVDLSTSQTLTNKKLTAPQIDQINDVTNNSKVVAFVGGTSSGNYFQFTGGTTGFTPQITAQGVDTNIGFFIKPKGTGIVAIKASTNAARTFEVQQSGGNQVVSVDTNLGVVFFGTSTLLAGSFAMYGGTSGSVTFVVPAISGSNTITFPAATDTLVGKATTDALSNKTLGNTNTVTLKQSLFTLQDASDTTKQAVFALSGITTATTRTYTLPDTSDTLATIAATQTLTNKRMQQRALVTANPGATPSINTDSYDIVTITAQAADITSMSTNLTGTPTEGQKLIIRIKDNGTARAITWGSSFRASSDLPLPTTTIISKTLYCGFIYNNTDSKWDLLALLNNF